MNNCTNSNDSTVEVTKTDSIEITPSQLNDIKRTVDSILESKIGTCTKDHGYILKIYDVFVDYNSITISRVDGNCFCPVRYNCLVFKPVVGDIYNAIVTYTDQWKNSKGFYDTVCVKYNYVNIILEEPKSPEEIQVLSDIQLGDTLSVQIRIIEYKTKEYSCIATVVIHSTDLIKEIVKV